jgi:tight adherence protein C
MLVLGLAALGLAIVILVVVIGERRLAKAQSGPAALGPSAAPAVVPVKRADPGELPSLYKRFASVARRLTPANYTRSLQHKLDLAGNPRGWTAERVLAFKGIGLLVGVVLGIAVGAKHGVGLLFFPIIGAPLGFFVADVWIRNLGERRQVEILKGLPDSLDMMTVCVEAGLGFDAALARVAQTLEGPMPQEFARVLQEMQFGLSRADALRALVGRTNVAELRTFVSSLIQSNELGISVGDVLREQAKEMRIRRRQRAEEKAQKLPVKILLPLITCLLPAMFVVVLGPAVINIIHTLGGLNK